MTYKGCFGLFGGGAGVQVFYLQTAVKMNDLAKIQLVQDLPGSEGWPVRDLFQREVDKDRARKQIKDEYLKNPDKVKFFNPLTIALLPITNSGKAKSEVGSVRTTESTIDGVRHIKYRSQGEFSVSYPFGDENLAELEVENNMRLVAIDGQHRLFALQELYKEVQEGGIEEQKAEISTWSIPIVILGIMNRGERANVASFLSFIRDIFVNINIHAKQLGVVRGILLAEDSLPHLATQILIDKFHQDFASKCAKVEQTIEDGASFTPSFIFNWRGLETNSPGYNDQSKLQLFDVAILDEAIQKGLYEIMTDLDVAGQLGFDSEEMKNVVDENGVIIDQSKNELLAKQVNNSGFVNALASVLTCFTPYRNCIKTFEDIVIDVLAPENDAGDRKVDLTGTHAVYLMTYGVNRASDDHHRQKVQQIASQKINMISENKKDKLTPLFRDNEKLAMRTLLYIFFELRNDFAEMDWSEYASHLVDLLNQSYDIGLWLPHPTNTPESHPLMSIRKHISYKRTYAIEGEKWKDIPKKMGMLMKIFIKALHIRNIGADDPIYEKFDSHINDGLKAVRSVYLKGYTSQANHYLSQNEPALYGQEKKERALAMATQNTDDVLGHLEDLLLTLRECDGLDDFKSEYEVPHGS